MKKDYIIIAEKTLKFLENNNINKLSIENILGKEKKNIFKNKKELLVNINRYFDYHLKKNSSNLEKTTPKDMLFEIMMNRYDILNMHRKSIKNLIKYYYTKPNETIYLIPSFFESIILMASLADINISGIKGAAKIKTIFILYILIIITWQNDESPSLEKTMTTLDRYLDQINKIANFVK